LGCVDSEDWLPCGGIESDINYRVRRLDSIRRTVVHTNFDSQLDTTSQRL
jgi:hypothetical protein